MLVIDDSGDRKDGTRTAHAGRQYLGRYGKTGNGIVTVTTLWAGERIYYPVHAVPCTPARHFARGKSDPEFRTKLAIGAELAVRARAAGSCFRAVVADSAYGDQDGFRGELAGAGLPFVMALRPRRGTWARAADAHTPVDAARALAWGGPDGARRLAAVTADPGTLPDKATWYLVTNLPRPGGPREEDSPWPAASLAGIVRIYGIRNWIEQGHKQVKDELGRPARPSRPPAATRRSPAARSASAGPPGPPLPAPRPPRRRPQTPATERGGPQAAPPPAPSWPRALRAVRAWLTPWTVLQRWWTAWSTAPPPPQLQALINSVTAGHGLNLYLPP